MDSKADKPHAICVPAPFVSHVKAMLNFAKLLHCKGFHISFVNTDFNHTHLLKSRDPNALDSLQDFRFESIPDGLSEEDAATQNPFALSHSVRTYLLAPFLDLIANINRTAPPVTCIVADSFMTFATIAAKELGITIASFISISACAFMGLKQFRALKEKGLAPLKDESYLTNGYLDTIIDWIPGMKFIRLRDLPTFVRTTDPNDMFFDFTIEMVERALEASAIIVHTFDALEREVINGLSTMFPRVFAIGPLQLLLNQMHHDLLNSTGCSPLKEEPKCLEWLDSWEPNSVIYVNFGSMTFMTKDQLAEFGMGPANSNHPFLLIIRPDLVRGYSALLPPEFIEKTRETGFIASWCSQEEVLNHPSIGVFLTHCGWNSIMESVFAGVPMLCWPFAADQQTNCRYTCNEWEIGIEISSDVKRNEVEKLVREMMEGEKGKRLKQNVMEWKKMAEEATNPAGSSSTNLDKVVNEVLSKDFMLPKIL